jgi:hypothetical protein
MRGWSSIVAGFLLLGLAYWSFTADGLGASALVCAAAAAFFFFRGAQGLEVDSAGDPTALIDFVRDPADAIVDTATDQLADWFNDDKKADEAGQGFDPDAAIARYLAQRGTETAPPVHSAPPRVFGRKGI